jgi:hypothetical protein
VALEQLERYHPATVRQVFYLIVTVGLIRNEPKSYNRFVGILTRLREGRDVPFEWVIDNLRTRSRPSCWASPADFMKYMMGAYRMDRWAHMDVHVEILIEKDAKPMHVYYVGDFDPSGLDIERDAKEKLTLYSGKRIITEGSPGPGDICWHRLAPTLKDLAGAAVRLPVKKGDPRSPAFTRQYGRWCLETEALTPTELRRRVEGAILSHIDQRHWAWLADQERREREDALLVVPPHPRRVAHPTA